MTKEELQAIKARCEAATPGPWEEVAESGEWWIIGAHENANYVVDTSGTSQGNIEFITHARADVPALVAEVERLNAALTLEGELMAATHAHAGAVIAQLEAKAALLQQADSRIYQLFADLGDVPIAHIATLTEPALRSQDAGIRYAGVIIATWLQQWKVNHG